MRHGHVHPELNQLQELVETLTSEMSTHMLKEEQVFFPRVKLIKKGESSLDSLREPVQRNLEEHSDTGELLESIRTLTHNYKLPEDACMSYKALYDGLSAFERETHWHVYLENSILFPRALESEKVPAAN
jgi:regulator of cell morphogenesis and NO signaling